MTISKVLLFKSGELLCQVQQECESDLILFRSCPPCSSPHTPTYIHAPCMHTHTLTHGHTQPHNHPPPPFFPQHTHTHTLSHTLSLTCTHARAHTPQTHARTHARTHTRTCSHTHTFLLFSFLTVFSKV